MQPVAPRNEKGIGHVAYGWKPVSLTGYPKEMDGDLLDHVRQGRSVFLSDLKGKAIPYVRTGRGFHYYFKSATPVKTKPGFVDKVDIKAEGGYVVAPPSKHISGIIYEWINKPVDSFPDLPSWVSNGMKASVPHRFSGITKKDFMHGKGIPAGHIRVNGQDIPISDIGKKDVRVAEIESNFIPEGIRNDTLFRLACSFRAKDVSCDTALSTIKAENQKRCKPPLAETEVKNIVNSAYKYEPTKVKSFNCTDLGNGKRLISLHGTTIRYCFAWKKWLIWDGKTWHIDNDGQIIRLAKDTVKRIYGETVLVGDDDQRRSLAKWAIKSEEEKKLKSMVALAQSEPGVPISPDQLDTNHYLLSCMNGTIDLKTGILKQHDPQDFITKMLLVEYNPQAPCPQWINFLETIFNGNCDLILFVQRAVGYSLTGDISEQCLFILHGTGANGKTVFIKTISNLLSDYAQPADFETFLIKKNDSGVRNDIARMQGKRFISAIEAESGKRLSENLIKSLTGGDTISAHFLFAEGYGKSYDYTGSKVISQVILWTLRHNGFI